MHARTRALLASALAGLALPAAARAGFSYAFVFGLPPEVQTVGSATHTDLVRLTTAGGQAGALWHSQPIQVDSGFTTSFGFRIEPGPIQLAGDGFALVIQDSPAGAGALGSGGSGLGYDGIARSVAVEFDTFSFSGEFQTPHVAIHTQGNSDNRADDTASLAHADLTPLGLDITDGADHVGVVQYVPGESGNPGTLSVYVDDVLVTSTAIDLAAVPTPGTSPADLTDQGQMRIGFTAGTGLADSIHVIDDWSVDDNTGPCASPYPFLGFTGFSGLGGEFTCGTRFGGTRPLTYSWTFNGAPLSDDGRIQGTSTPVLHILDVSEADQGNYECTVVGPCGTTTSGVFEFNLHPPCNLADITEVGGTSEFPGHPDFQLTVDDIIAFINLFSDGSGCPGATPCSLADITAVGGPPEPPDGQLTVDDLIAFINAFGDGC